METGKSWLSSLALIPYYRMPTLAPLQRELVKGTLYLASEEEVQKQFCELTQRGQGSLGYKSLADLLFLALTCRDWVASPTCSSL